MLQQRKYFGWSITLGALHCMTRRDSVCLVNMQIRRRRKTDKAFLGAGYGPSQQLQLTQRGFWTGLIQRIRLIMIGLAANAQDTCLEFSGYKKAPASRVWPGHPPKWSHPVKKAKAKLWLNCCWQQSACWRQWWWPPPALCPRGRGSPSLCKVDFLGKPGPPSPGGDRTEGAKAANPALCLQAVLTKSEMRMLLARSWSTSRSSSSW